MLGGRGAFRWRGAFSGISLGYRAVTADTTLTTSDHTVNVTSGSVNITLPAATAESSSTSASQNVAAGITGKVFVIVNNGAGTVTLIGTVNGVTNPTIAAGSRMTIQSTGSTYIQLH